MKKKKRNGYFAAGGICFLVAILNRQFGVLPLALGANMSELVSGACTGLGLLFEWIGFYNHTHEVPFPQRKKEVFARNK